MRVKRQYRTVSKDNYERFCAANPSVKITFKKYREVIKVCNQMYMKQALDTGELVKLPFGFGVIVVSKKKTTTSIIKDGEKIIVLPVDWVESKKQGVKVYNMNYHTSGYRYKWKWYIDTCLLYQKDVWLMKPCRYASRAIAKYVKDTYYAQLYKEWKPRVKY